MAREWHQLSFDERELYYQWIWSLMDAGRLYFDNMDDIEAYAKEMYRCDVDQTPNKIDDPFVGLNIRFDSDV